VSEEPDQIIDEILDDLIPTFEKLESRSLAILRFLKDKNIATEKELQPFLDQAANASEVEWRAARLRLRHLFVSAFDALQKAAEDSARKAAGGEAEASGVKDGAEEKAGERGDDKAKKEPPEKPVDRPESEQKSPSDDAADRESQSQSQTEGNEPEKSEDAA
jgi:hypothetical protein